MGAIALLGWEHLFKWVLPGERELLYCLRLFFSAVRGLAHFSGDAGFRARNCTSKFALRPDSSVVERGPEKAGVGGSIPSLATTS
jgi:hypothetical protein